MTHGRQKIYHHLAIVTRSQFSKTKRYNYHPSTILEIITEMLSFKIALNYIQSHHIELIE